MEKKVASGIMLTLLLISMLTLAFNIQPVKAWTGTVYIRADGSIDPPDALVITFDNVTYTLTGNITSDADGIVVERDNIIVDGAGYTLEGTGSGRGIDLSGRTNVTVRNTQIKNFYYGIWLSYSSYNSISGNNITANDESGIRLDRSYSNSISGNNLANNWEGIYLWGSSRNIISGNTFTNNGLGVWDSYQNVVEDNTVNGKPLVYLEGSSDVVVEDAGQVVLVNCNRIRVENLSLSNATLGVLLWRTNNTIIAGNNMTNNWAGIRVNYSSNNSVSRNNITNNERGILLDYSSNNNVISGNNITANSYADIQLSRSSNNNISGNNITNSDNGIELYNTSNNVISRNNITNNRRWGIFFWESSNNKIYHNDFINNGQQAFVATPGYANVWDDGYPSGGNYWSDYEERYPDAKELDGSGIWDTPYVIDGYNQDNYPLMEPWTPEVHDVAIVSVSPSATEVYVGQVVNITVIVKNEGNATETFSVRCKYELEDSEYLIGTQTVKNLAPNTNTTLTFTWTTTDITVHTIKAEILPIAGETDIADNTMTSPSTVKVKLLGDVNGDDKVDISDLAQAALAFGSYANHPRWNSQADINQDNKIDIRDLALTAKNFGKTDP